MCTITCEERDLYKKNKKNEHIRYKLRDTFKRETYGERDIYRERFAYKQEIQPELDWDIRLVH